MRSIYLLINEYQAQHWPAQTPLVATVFKQYDLKEGLQNLGMQTRDTQVT